MKSELDKIMEWYEINLDCQKIMKSIIKNNSEIIPLESILVSKSIKDTKVLLETSITELKDLTILSLVSTFEQTLLRYLKEFIDYKIDSKDEITVGIRSYINNQAERGRFTDILDLFKPRIDSQLIGMVKQVYEYRNWVAHGKKPKKVPSKIDPLSAYEKLSDFLSQVKMIKEFSFS